MLCSKLVSDEYEFEVLLNMPLDHAILCFHGRKIQLQRLCSTWNYSSSFIPPKSKTIFKKKSILLPRVHFTHILAFYRSSSSCPFSRLIFIKAFTHFDVFILLIHTVIIIMATLFLLSTSVLFH